MTSRIVNGGKAVMPHLTFPAGQEADTTAPLQSIGVSEASLARVIRGMVGVVNEPFGTAGRSAIREPGLEMGGKTGTSQVRRISKAERARGVRKNDEKPWEERDHALFIGFAPIEAPRFACAVVVEHGGGGSKAAAPIARDVLYECQLRNPAATGPVSKLVPEAGKREG